MTAFATAAGFLESACDSPFRMTTRMASPGSGIPNGSLAPFTTSTRTPWLAADRSSSSRMAAAPVPALRRARGPAGPRGPQREGQRDHPRRRHRHRGTAGHPGPVAPATHDQRNAPPRRQPGSVAQGRDDLLPRLVLAGGRAGRTGSPDPVRLSDQGHRAAQPEGGVPGGQQVGRGDRPPGAVGEREQEGRGPRPAGQRQLSLGLPLAGRHLHRGHGSPGDGGHRGNGRPVKRRAASSGTRRCSCPPPSPPAPACRSR